MSLLLIGAGGQVGAELKHTLASLGTVVAVDRSHLDLTDRQAIERLVSKVQPKIIINAAAYTAVDKAESEPELAYAVNAVAPKVLAEAAENMKATLVHFSTDYVFDGCHYAPYLEDDRTAPTNGYGRSKLAGEEAIRQICQNHLIIRTAWVYGTCGKGNFVKTMLRLGAERPELRVVSDQIGTPTCARDIADATAKLVSRLCLSSAFEPSLLGTYHFTNSGVASWYDFALAIFEEAAALGFPLKLERVVPIATSEYPTPANRPAYSVLSCQKICSVLGEIPPHWRQSLKKMLAELYTKTYESSYSIGR